MLYTSCGVFVGVISFQKIIQDQLGLLPRGHLESSCRLVQQQRAFFCIVLRLQSTVLEVLMEMNGEAVGGVCCTGV